MSYYDEDKGATFSIKEKDKAYLAEPPQPSLTTKIPRITKDSRLHEGVRIFAPFLPTGGKRVQILGVGVAPTPEEATGLMEASHGVVIPTTPRLMKGPLYSIITDAINRTGHLQADNFAYTTVIPWLLPKNRRYKPKPDELKLGAENLHEWIKELKPECIVAFGKVAFDQLCSYRISADDARGGWFTYLDTNIPLYLADPVVVYLTQPWMMDTLITDFREVNRFLHGKFGMGDEDVVEEYTEIRTIAQLEELVAKWERENRTLFSVDCEWAGSNYVDGRLRSIQFCWEAGKAAYLNFFDETGEKHLGAELFPDNTIEAWIHPNQWAGPGEFYTDYERVGQILGRWLNRPEIRYIGHFFVADSVWMEHWLGLEVLGRCAFDTGYAQQTANEYARLGLEVLAMKYTSFGRYDMALMMWKRENRVAMDEEDGYGKIPDSILVRYGMIDVDVVMRAYPIIRDDLERQNLTDYFNNLLLPFVTDTFHTFTTTGLPVDRYLFEQTRKFFNWAYRALLADFRQMLLTQADQTLSTKLGIPLVVIQSLSAMRDNGQVTQASTALNTLVANLPERPEKWEAFVGHWQDAANFNIRSPLHMRRWLFDVLGLTPVKTTKNAENGMPSMLWEKVLELPEKLQKTLQPAVDKETIEILSSSDESGSLLRLLAVSNVGNQCKGFLKEGEYGLDGELEEEHGLAKYICSDNRIRARYALTETGRPRTGDPNILNLSKYHNKGVEMGLARVLDQRGKNPLFDIPEELLELLGTAEEREKMTPKQLIKKRMPSIRSVIAAPDGWCQVESDFQTAEVRGLAFASGDKQLLKLILSKDKSFGLIKVGDDKKPVRLYYEENSAIAPSNRDPKFLMALCEEGKEPQPITPDQLLRDANGELLHPKFDMHWAVAEESQKRPRETMSADRDRGAGKVTRFCIAEGELVLTRDRGEVAIENVLGCDLLWDGVEWVSHEGILYSGFKKVITYQGLKATAKHKVWTEERGKVSLGEACSQSLTLVRTGSAGRCLGYTGDNHSSRIAETRGSKAVFHGGHRLPGLRGKAGKVSPESGERLLVEVQVPDGAFISGALSGYAVGGCGVFESSLPSDAATLREGHTQFVNQLQGARNQVLISERSGVCELGSCELVSGGDHGQRVRSHRQRRALRGFKPAACDESGKRAEQAVHYGDSSGNCTAVLEGQSAGEIYGEHRAKSAEAGLQSGADSGAGESQYACGAEEEVRTYDILNAGPRNRFTCSGVLVSNSGSYGAVGATIDRRIEAVTGIKPEPGTGQKMLDALAESQPVATEFLNNVALQPKTGTPLVAASGRIRHFPIHSGELKDMPWRVRNSYLRAMGNEARNFYMQESVAATAARACKWLNNFFRSNGMKARVMVALYDAVSTLCPLEERFVVAEAHQLFMCDINVWHYHGRYMNYPIDTDILYRWSWKPTDKEKQILHDKGYRNMPEERERELMEKLAFIRNTFFQAQPHIKERLNVI